MPIQQLRKMACGRGLTDSGDFLILTGTDAIFKTPVRRHPVGG